MKKTHSANYDFADQHDPRHPMGHGSYANMPERPIMASYGEPEDYRDGIVNSFTCTLKRITGISENEK